LGGAKTEGVWEKTVWISIRHLWGEGEKKGKRFGEQRSRSWGRMREMVGRNIEGVDMTAKE